MATLLRGIIIIALIIGLVLLVQAGTAEPGSLVFNWYGYQITTSATFFIAAFNVALILAFYGGRLAAWALSLPKRLNGAYYRRQDKHALATVVKGLDALTAGDAQQSARLATQIKKSLPDAQLANTLAAHIHPTQEHLHSLLANPETAFAGHSGLLEEAIALKEWAGAKFHAEAALKKRPNSPKIQRAYFNTLLHTGDCSGALGLLPKLKRSKAFGDTFNLIEAAVRLHVAIGEQSSNPTSALRQAQQAEKACPRFVPAALFRASTLASLGKNGPAERALAEFWHTCPRLDVFEKWLEVVENDIGDADPSKILKKVDALVKGKLNNPDEGAIAALCYGSAALKLGELETARTYLEKAFQKSVSRQVLRRLAELERRTGDESAAQDWLEQALDAPNLAQQGDDVLAAYQEFRQKYGLEGKGNVMGLSSHPSKPASVGLLSAS